VKEELMAATSATESTTEEPLVEETLVEEVSIDGMCGVY
jgi:mycofactocin precursor